MNTYEKTPQPNPQQLLVQALQDIEQTHHFEQVISKMQARNLIKPKLIRRHIPKEIWKLVQKEEPSPPPPPPQVLRLELDTGYISFSDGVPVGGYSHLSLFPNGAYSFTGHFHDSGSTSYDASLVWVLKSASGTVFTFAQNGRLHGTFEAGSRDYDWGDSGTNAALASAWADISLGYTWQWSSAVNIDFGSLLDGALKAVGAIATVVKIIG